MVVYIKVIELSLIIRELIEGINFIKKIIQTFELNP